MRLNAVELRRQLSEVLDRAESRGQRVIVQRRGKDAAAIISIEDLKLLERLIEEEEDRIDLAAARASLAESEESAPLAEVRKRLGLDDGPKTTRGRTGARTKAI